ncbi:ABC transporter permease [Litchfieldella qijiaojingensis]|uniref:ABC transporter permease n=1 Tax=Litchfieldella qijiaojingensis TaxID=980347 RepID=A0ABQ2Z4D0_9GAMM|nr:metal ABC transporter permease [Halomonas qijiaojingensis]GGY02069.1 ABC transporter permease [Halomonas qijiaojingensis]
MLDMLSHWILAPLDYGFMRRALVACIALSLTAPVMGVLLTLRGMSLMSEPLSHAIMPGVAIAFLLSGFSLSAMMLGGIVAGLVTVGSASGITLVSGLKEDAAMASLFLTAMAIGVLLISLRGSALDLGHVLFGSILAVDTASLMILATVTSGVLIVLAAMFRALVVESLDPAFLASQGTSPSWIHGLFMSLVVLSLVIGFQTLGTLMAVGLMLLPATMARFWSRRLEGLMAIAIGWSLFSSLAGLLLSYHAGLPSGPAIILVVGAGYVVSLLIGPYDSLLIRLHTTKHRNASP